MELVCLGCTHPGAKVQGREREFYNYEFLPQAWIGSSTLRPAIRKIKIGRIKPSHLMQAALLEFHKTHLVHSSIGRKIIFWVHCSLQFYQVSAVNLTPLKSKQDQNSIIYRSYEDQGVAEMLVFGVPFSSILLQAYNSDLLVWP